MAMTPAQWQAKAIEETGGSTTNAKFKFAMVYGTSGGSFTVEINGLVTAPVLFPASVNSLRFALEALPTVGAGGAKVKGALGGPYEVEFVGANAGQDVPPPVIEGALLNPPQDVEVEVVSFGQTNDFSEDAAEAWVNNAAARSDKLRFLYVKLELLEKRLGGAIDWVDTRTGQVNEIEEKASQITLNLEKRKADVLAAINTELDALAAGARRTYGGPMTTTTTNGKPYGVMGTDPTSGRLR